MNAPSAELAAPPARAVGPLGWVLILAALGLLWLGAPALRFSVGNLANPYSLDREEGFLLVQALRLQHGDTIYPVLDDYPFLVGNYPPVYPLLASVLTWDDPATLLGPRLAALLMGALAVVATGALAFTISRSIAGGVLASATFAASYEFGAWLPFARVDTTALGFSLAGFALGVHAATPGRRAAALGLLLLGLFAKQTQFLPLVAVLVIWALRDGVRGVLVPAASAMAVIAAVVGGLTIATGGQYWLHTVTYNANEWRSAVAIGSHRHVLFLHFGSLVAIAALGVVLVVLREGLAAPVFRTDPQAPPFSAGALRVLAATTALSLVMAMVTFGKVGSAINYFLEFAALASAFVGAAVGRIERTRLSGPPAWGLAGVALSLTLSAAGMQAWRAAAVLEGNATRALMARGAFAEAEITLTGMQGELLSEDPILAWRLGQSVLYQPFIMSQLAREGRWDAAPLLGDIEARRFAAIVTTEDLASSAEPAGWTPAMRAAILSRYAPVKRIGGGGIMIVIHRPR